MPYKAEEREGKWVVVNTDTDDVKKECADEKEAKRMVTLLGKVEDEYSQ